MKQKLAVLGILSLAFVALLGVGAAPAVAATCADCHTSPDGPPAPDCGALVAGVDCATCHKNMSPHGTAFATPEMRLNLEGADQIAGRLGWPGWIQVWTSTVKVLFGIPDVTVYLQQRLWGTSDWTDLTQVVTAGGNFPDKGRFGYTVPSPTPWAAYRAVAEGGLKSESVVRMPVSTVWRPTPTLTLKLTQVPGVFASGSARPLSLAGENVTVTAYKHRAAPSRWVKVRTRTAVIGADGTYSCWVWGPLGGGPQEGSYRLRASIAGTADHTVVRTTWRYFKRF